MSEEDLVNKLEKNIERLKQKISKCKVRNGRKVEIMEVQIDLMCEVIQEINGKPFKRTWNKFKESRVLL